ncbi:MAG: hypothetical protein LBI68_09530 [Azoarcus sp.]|jgi:Zn-dependent peptidase ImmA (M78 family)|nr:hypothetical protein [Azoarcus sp.]
MPKPWSITANWELLETGSPEERASFAMLGIYVYGSCLTEGHDRLSQSIRQAPYLSAYHFAEWLAWNWWRLRWEPRRVSPEWASPEWELSHATASIGSGYIWPNILFISDGENLVLISKPSPERARTPYRYINDIVNVIPAVEFENEVDIFVEAVLQRLQDQWIVNSNLSNVWKAVLHERQDPVLFRQRKLEALLGEDPGEMDENQLQRLLDNADATGQAALEEIAANHNPGQEMPDVPKLLDLSRSYGIPTNPKDRITLRDGVPRDADRAWKLGENAARELRKQENIPFDGSITDDQLTSFYGAPKELLKVPDITGQQPDLSLDLFISNQESQVMLRSKYKNGRRFELARLLGDSLIHSSSDPLRPATRSATYRQKAQRAFAAELLSPFQAVDEMLEGDYSMESQQDIAQHFLVSDLTIRTQLVNHGRIPRSELGDFD